MINEYKSNEYKSNEYLFVEPLVQPLGVNKFKDGKSLPYHNYYTNHPDLNGELVDGSDSGTTKGTFDVDGNNLCGLNDVDDPECVCSIIPVSLEPEIKEIIRSFFEDLPESELDQLIKIICKILMMRFYSCDFAFGLDDEFIDYIDFGKRRKTLSDLSKFIGCNEINYQPIESSLNIVLNCEEVAEVDGRILECLIEILKRVIDNYSKYVVRLTIKNFTIKSDDFLSSIFEILKEKDDKKHYFSQLTFENVVFESDFHFEGKLIDFLSKVRFLKFINCTLSCKQIQSIAYAISNIVGEKQYITFLSFINSIPLNDAEQSMTIISKALNDIKSLIGLDFSDNNISDKDINKFIKILFEHRSCPNLEFLNFSGNCITKKCFKHLTESFHKKINKKYESTSIRVEVVPVVKKYHDLPELNEMLLTNFGKGVFVREDDGDYYQCLCVVEAHLSKEEFQKLINLFEIIDFEFIGNVPAFAIHKSQIDDNGFDYLYEVIKTGKCPFNQFCIDDYPEFDTNKHEEFIITNKDKMEGINFSFY